MIMGCCNAISPKHLAMFLFEYLSFCLMPNHWHFVVWTTQERQLQRFFKLFTGAHTQAWHARHQRAGGTGHVYQGRYKSFIVQKSAKLLSLCSYVERHALAAGLVDRAEDWRFGSAYHRAHNTKLGDWLWDEWPVERNRKQWLDLINQLPHEKTVKEIQTSSRLGKPYGDEEWCQQQSRGMIWRKPGRPSSVQNVDKIMVPDPII